MSGPIRPGQKRVCIVGHSFVKRMKNYISNDTNRLYSNLNLPVAKFRVRLEGFGGWKMQNLRSWLPTSFGEEKIDLIYIEMGGNDLSDGVDPKVLAKHLTAFADYLCVSQGVKAVYLGQCLGRFKNKGNTQRGLSHEHLHRFNRNVITINKELERRCKSLESCNVRYWRHRGGFWGPACRRLFNKDGIHIGEDIGMKRYIESIRHAVLHASNHKISE